MDNKEGNIASNEAIVEDLTKDLEKCCTKEDVKSAHASSKDDDKYFKVTPDPDEKEIVDPEVPPKTEDFIDEERLKDRELELTDEEKEELKCEAEKLKSEGNNFFVASEFRKAIETYTEALRTCPLAFPKDRAVLYANRAAAKAKCDEKLSALDDCTKAVELNPHYLKALLRRAQLYEQTDKLDESLEDYKKILEMDPGNSEANHAVRRLPPLIQEKNEKLKDEMLSKLKDLGNMILKPFGLSTNNFQMEQDPSTGGYSVKFNQGTS